jgi:ribosome-associated heat shock protein Hsp15
MADARNADEDLAAVVGEPPLRIDRWLWGARLFKTRSLAAAAVSGGKVHVNGERVKPARLLRSGDRLTLRRGALEFECCVLAMPVRRGSAAQAGHCYEESAASVARRALFAQQMKLAAASAPRPPARPDKHARRELRRIRGRES